MFDIPQILGLELTVFSWEHSRGCLCAYRQTCRLLDCQGTACCMVHTVLESGCKFVKTLLGH